MKALVLAAAIACGAPLIAANAQQPIAGADPFAVAFAESMARPSDPDAALRFARIAADRGDVRAAIAALDRVLRINPSLDNIRLELASLYLAAGSSDIAALYARQALESPNIPPDVAARARQILAQAERGAARSLLDVNLFAGARWDSNANGVTAAGVVPIYVPAIGAFVPAQLPASGQASWSSTLGARVAHRYDLELQREGAWETNGSFFNQRFASIPRYYDLTAASFDTGPRIGVADIGETGTLALRPFTTAAYLGYADDTYAWLYGGGLTAELRLGSRWSFEATALSQFGNFQNSAFRPTSREYTGWETTLSAGVTYTVSSATRLFATMSYITADAREDFYQRSGYGGRVGVQTSFRLAGYELAATARGGAITFGYDAPDPTLNPFLKRRDTRWAVGGALIMPVTNALAVVLEADWFDQNSNYEIYSFNNTAVTIGIRASF